jgi:uncharacterized protein
MLGTRITLSIEGRKERHRALRTPFLEKDYEILVENTKLLVNKLGSSHMLARLTLFGDYWEVCDEVEFLITLGIRNFKILPDLGVSKEKCLQSLENLKNSFGKRITGREISLFPINVHPQEEATETCGVGESMICLATDLNFYPCHRFVHRKEFVLGSLDKGLDAYSLVVWKQKMDTRRNECRQCKHLSACNFPCVYPNPEAILPHWCLWLTGSEPANNPLQT